MVKKTPKTLPIAMEQWIKFFNKIFEEQHSPGIVYVFTKNLEAAKSAVMNAESFSQLKADCHKLLLIEEPEATFIPSKDLDLSDYHGKIILNSIADIIYLNSQVLIDEQVVHHNFFALEINPNSSGRFSFIIKFGSLSEDEKNWIKTEEKIIYKKCLDCQKDKKPRGLNFGLPKEKIPIVTGSR